MFVVGLTGGIGSGKSVVAKIFADKSVPIIDADITAREITQKGTPALASIVEHFGVNILLPDGSLDRKALRQLIFSDKKQRLWLEELLHPLIRIEMHNQIKNFSAPYCIAVIPLLLEVEFYSFINRILVVDTKESIQIERVQIRDQINPVEIQAIIDSQAKAQDRRAKAHDIIVNDGTIADLLPQVEKLHALYLELAENQVNS